MNTFTARFRTLAGLLLETEPIHTGEWHSRDTSESAAHATFELLNVQQRFAVPPEVHQLQTEIVPNLPWAEAHFLERVSGLPHNPPPSHVLWPWASHNSAHQDPMTQKFSHTYPERYWPKYANDVSMAYSGRSGIRYEYGDLGDVVRLLIDKPLTRQAYLPVWFPEDTGNSRYVRVPCSLGYHFMIRNQQLHCWYSLRSCDFIRHYRDDVYMTARLVQWVAQQVSESRKNVAFPIEPGVLHVTISSLHAFVGESRALGMIARHGRTS